MLITEPTSNINEKILVAKLKDFPYVEKIVYGKNQSF